MLGTMKRALCVDLDGTLIKTDMLLEGILALLRSRPLHACMIPFWLLRGKATLKSEIAKRVAIEAATLPYRQPLLEHLEKECASGRRLFLATASPVEFARTIAEHLGFFSGVVATDGGENLVGREKAKRLCELFGEKNFDYAGNDRKDLAVWRCSGEAILVNSSGRMRDQVEASTKVAACFNDRTASIGTYVRALRLHQWIKNLLIFVPIIAIHRVTDLALLRATLLALFAFSFVASAVYLLNDLLDLPSDRQHPDKKLRPLASGELPIHHALFLVPALLGAALGLGFFLSSLFEAVLMGYFVATVAYSLALKRLAVLDVIVLAGFYTVRIVAGSVATHIPPSFWLLAFSMFVFLSLALVKRYSELSLLQRSGSQNAAGRGYGVEDLPLLVNLGCASGYLSVLVLALYITSANSHVYYRHPEAIWLLCPILLFWISWLWLKAHRGQICEDPIIFALRDPVSGWAALLGVIAVWIAI